MVMLLKRYEDLVAKKLPMVRIGSRDRPISMLSKSSRFPGTE